MKVVHVRQRSPKLFLLKYSAILANSKFYLPGVLSLLLLFPACYYKLYRWGVLEENRTLEVIWYTQEAHYNTKFPPRRFYSRIDLTGNAAHDNRKIKQAKNFLLRLSVRKDGSQGLHVHLSDHARYESFVTILSFCDSHQLQFAPSGSDVWIFKRVN